jgi:pimeloyl-ACP methyl ester carboxylesterase
MAPVSDRVAAAITGGRARVGEIEIAYDTFGTSGRPLVLVMGIGAQRVLWSDDLCEQFVAAGFHVARFDHRDIGESSKLDLPVPRPGRALVRRMFNLRVDAPYTLSDMAADVAGLIDHLGFGSAHVVGTSLGGMVAQHLAIEHPDRVRSLTSIMSTPGGRRYVPKPFALGALFRKPPKTAEQAGEHMVGVFETIGSRAWPRDADRERIRRAGELAFSRGMNPRGFLRHFAAVLATYDRRPKLREVKAPTLIIHGSCDPMFPLAAGRDMTRMMPHATWLPIAGMGHDLPIPLWPVLVRAIARHAERADALAAAR